MIYFMKPTIKQICGHDIVVVSAVESCGIRHTPLENKTAVSRETTDIAISMIGPEGDDINKAIDYYIVNVYYNAVLYAILSRKVTQKHIPSSGRRSADRCSLEQKHSIKMLSDASKGSIISVYMVYCCL